MKGLVDWFLGKFGKKFTTLIIGFIVTICNQKFGLDIPEDQMRNLLYGVIALIGGQSIADGLSKGATSSVGK